MKNLKKISAFCLLALAFTLVFAEASFADSVMETARVKAVNVFEHVKTIIFVVGAFGLVGIAFQAIFGKVKWTWFAGLAVGLGILAAASAVVKYATGDSAGTAGIADTFGGDASGQ